MKYQLGLVSDAYKTNNEFGIDFDSFKKYGIRALDYQGLINYENAKYLYSLPENDFVNYFKKLSFQIAKNGLIVNQLHALWKSDFKNDTDDIDIVQHYKKAIVAAGYLHCKYVVIHPIPIKGFYLWEKVDCQAIANINTDLLKELLPTARKFNVNIAVENLPFLALSEFFSPSGTLKFVQEFNDPNVKMCLDTGHFNMFKDEKIYDFLLKTNDKLGCLHIHDNDGTDDFHQIPFLGTFDWTMFLRGLREINYRGILSLETKDAPNDENIALFEKLLKEANKL